MSANYSRVVKTVLGIEVKRMAFAPMGDPATVVAAVPGKHICVLGIYAIAPLSTQVTFYSGDPSNNKPLSGPFPLTSSLPLSLQLAPDPALAWMVTDAGESLMVDPTIGNVMKGVLVYYEMDANP